MVSTAQMQLTYAPYALAVRPLRTQQ